MEKDLKWRGLSGKKKKPHQKHLSSVPEWLQFRTHKISSICFPSEMDHLSVGWEGQTELPRLTEMVSVMYFILFFPPSLSSFLCSLPLAPGIISQVNYCICIFVFGSTFRRTLNKSVINHFVLVIVSSSWMQMKAAFASLLEVC